MKKLFFAFISLTSAANLASAQKAAVYFDYAKQELTPQSIKTIDSLAAVLTAKPEQYRIQLVGHTDSDGNKSYNQQLSQNRCIAVQNYLVAKGFPATNFKIEGRNYTDSVTTNTNDMGKARNRRVELDFALINTDEKHPTITIKDPKKEVSKTTSIDRRPPNVGITIPKQTVSFSASQGTTISYASGTTINIPADILMYADGKPVQGEVQVQYYEMRDAADFIAAGIPMDFKGNLFNSAGMFEIQVSQNGQEVFVQPDKYYTMNFMKTGELPDLGFYRYERGTNEWTILGKLDERAETFNANTKSPCYQPNNGYRITAKDTVNTFKKAMDLGLELAKNQGLILQYAAGVFPTVEERWASPDFAGMKPLGDTEWFKADMALETSVALDKSKLIYTDGNKTHIVAQNHTYFETKTVGNNFRELSILNDINWIYLKKGETYELNQIKNDWMDGAKVNTINGREIMGTNNPNGYEIVDDAGFLYSQKRRWTDARLEYKGDGAFELVLKGEGYARLKIYPEASLGDAQRDKICRSIFERYQTALAQRCKEENDKVAEHKAHWDYFLEYSKPFRQGNEPCMSKRDWINYFNTNHGETMRPRYVLLNAIPAHADSIAMRLNTGTLPAPPVADAGSELSQTLKLNGFGVFNCDQIIRLGNSIEMIADYKTPDGASIPAAFLYIIDHRLNTAMSFYSPNEFNINPKSETTLFIRDDFGRSYIVRPDTLKAANPKNGGVYTLVAEDMTGKLNNTDDLRRELGLVTR